MKMEKWAKTNEDTSTDVIVKSSRSREKLTIIINDKWLAYTVEEETRLRPKQYSSMAEFIRIALTKEANSNQRWQLS
jgi:hypothetical protein